jgi:hypothetical protein
MGQSTYIVLEVRGSGPMNSGLSGRWDRSRTGALRLWSLLPSVQPRSGTYTSTLKVAHFEDPTCLDVHHRSPALGSTLESKQPEILFSTACHLKAQAPELEQIFG